jgi:hypothetical protein
MSRVLRAVLVSPTGDPQNRVLVGLLAYDLEDGVSSLRDDKLSLDLTRRLVFAEKPP